VPAERKYKDSEVRRKRMRGKDMKNSKQDAWSKNDEKLYKLMGGKSKTRYNEDQATYRDFGRTFGGPTDAVGVAQRKRREAGNFSGNATNKKLKELKKSVGMSKSAPKKIVKRAKPQPKKNVKKGVK
jgi:hypothetical protein